MYNLAAQLRDLAEGDDPSGRNLALGRFQREIRVVIEARDRARAHARAEARAAARESARAEAQVSSKY